MFKSELFNIFTKSEYQQKYHSLKYLALDLWSQDLSIFTIEDQNRIRTLMQSDISAYYECLNQLNAIASPLKNNVSNVNEMYNFFETHSIDGRYGVDQSVIENQAKYYLNGQEYSYSQARAIVNDAYKNGYVLPHFSKIGTHKYHELKNKLITQGFSSSEASIILSSINDAGACSYASLCNEIFYHFRNNPTLFEQTFGYPMYVEVNGKKVLNGEDLLLDLYLFANDVNNGGHFFIDNKINPMYLSTSIDIHGNRILDAEKQIYMSNSSGRNQFIIEMFLKSKNPDLVYNTNVFIEHFDEPFSFTVKKMQERLMELSCKISEGYSAALGYYKGPNIINMISYNQGRYPNMNTDIWEEGEGHSVAIVDILDQGLVVSSWGNKYLIPIEDLRKGNFTITISKIS